MIRGACESRRQGPSCGLAVSRTVLLQNSARKASSGLGLSPLETAAAAAHHSFSGSMATSGWTDTIRSNTIAIHDPYWAQRMCGDFISGSCHSEDLERRVVPIEMVPRAWNGTPGRIGITHHRCRYLIVGCSALLLRI